MTVGMAAKRKRHPEFSSSKLTVHRPSASTGTVQNTWSMHFVQPKLHGIMSACKRDKTNQSPFQQHGREPTSPDVRTHCIQVTTCSFDTMGCCVLTGSPAFVLQVTFVGQKRILFDNPRACKRHGLLTRSSQLQTWSCLVSEPGQSNGSLHEDVQHRTRKTHQTIELTSYVERIMNEKTSPKTEKMCWSCSSWNTQSERN